MEVVINWIELYVLCYSHWRTPTTEKHGTTRLQYNSSSEDQPSSHWPPQWFHIRYMNKAITQRWGFHMSPTTWLQPKSSYYLYWVVNLSEYWQRLMLSPWIGKISQGNQSAPLWKLFALDTFNIIRITDSSPLELIPT